MIDRMIAPDICDEGSIFMEFRTIEQLAQLSLLDEYFKMRNQYLLSEFFRKQNIWDDDLLADKECYTFFQEIHAHNLKSMLVNFTCIYVPPIDQFAYGVKDAMDILEERQNEKTFVFELLMPKGEVTERKLRSMVAFANHLGISIYMSVADYVRMKRVSDNLYGVSSIVLDLDTYHSVHEYDTDEEMLQEMRPVIDRIGKEPNMYINSGHGRYLVFSFNNINLSIPEMRKLYQETVKKLIFQFKEFGADAKCSDITRVFRIPGNINPKTGKNAYIVEHFESRTTLSELASAVGICRGKTVSDKKDKSRQRKFEMYYKTIGRSRYAKVNRQRDEDFNTLLKLRNYDMKGYRNILFHLMSVNCFYAGMDRESVTTYLHEINNSLVSPYDELDAVIRYAEKNFETYGEDYESAVKYRNRTIVALLEVTKEEQKHMKQLIDQDEADERLAESSKKKAESQRKKKLENTAEKASRLKEDMLMFRYQRLMDNKQIAVQVERDERTVERQIGETPKFVLVGRMSREEAVYYHCHWGHKTNAEIAEIMGISVSSVHNAKRKLKSMEQYADI